MGGGAARIGGIGGAGAIVVFLIAMFLGVDPSQLLGPGGMDQGTGGAPVGATSLRHDWAMSAEVPNVRHGSRSPDAEQPCRSCLP